MHIIINTTPPIPSMHVVSFSMIIIRRSRITKQFSTAITRHSSPPPSESDLAALLESCIARRCLSTTRLLHTLLLKTPHSTHTFLLNRLLHAYSLASSLPSAVAVFRSIPSPNTFSFNALLAALFHHSRPSDAVSLFDSIPSPDICSWNTLVSGLAHQCLFSPAVRFFLRMRREFGGVGTHAFASVLTACAGLGDVRIGEQVHGVVVRSPVRDDVFLGSALVDMYAKCGRVEGAEKVFEEMPDRNVVTWNSMISCYEQNGDGFRALGLFKKRMMGVVEVGFNGPDEVTFASVVSACAGVMDGRCGREVHGRVVKEDGLRRDLVLSNALVDMYSKCGRMREARTVFDGMPLRNLISETSMISGYARAANVGDARKVFGRMVEKNVIAWNALISGYSQNGNDGEALRLFWRLKKEGVCPTHYTFGNVLSSCGNLTDLPLGRQTHGHVLKHGFRFEFGPESDVFVGNSLIDMYLKCGAVVDGRKVFDKMVARDRVSWNAMIVGYAQNGRGKEALVLFERMLSSGETPDHVTMIGVLSGCSHAGLVEEGQEYFECMTTKHGVVPNRDHYTCMVDMLGRAGRLKEVKNFVDRMPVEPDAILWASLLASCKIHQNTDLGEEAAKRLLELNPGSSGPYVLLSNMYAEKGQWEDVVRVRKLMKNRGVVKQPGCSWIEIERKVYVFMVKDKRNPQRREIYGALRSLMLHMKRNNPFLTDGGEQIFHLGQGNV